MIKFIFSVMNFDIYKKLKNERRWLKMQSYNKKGEKKFYIIIDGLIFLACFMFMIFEKRVNLFILGIGLIFLIKTLYNIKTLKKL